MLDGLAASISERGYRDTTVADIVRHARTSKRTFYGQFSSKEECFIELLRSNNDAMITRIRTAVDPEADWRAQIRQAVDAYVDHIEARPAITLSWIREAPALGAVAQPLHRLAMSRADRHARRSQRQPGVPARGPGADHPPVGAASCSAVCAN